MDRETFNKIKLAFQDNYFKNIKPNLDKYEKKREKYWFICNSVLLPITILICLVSLIVPSILASTKENIVININLIPTTICATVYFLIFNFLEKKLDKEIKQEFMPSVCKCFENLSWEQGGYQTPNEFKEVGLVNEYNQPKFDDIFFGNYKNVNFEIIEAEFKQGRIDNGHHGHHHENEFLRIPLGDKGYLVWDGKNIGYRKNHSVTIFKGIILKIDTEKDFNTHTIIRPDGLLKLDIQNLKRTEFEDVVFEQKYDVFTDDEVEARVIITTALMERINNIEKIFKAKKVSCAFKGKTAYIGLESKEDLFKTVKLKEPTNDGAHFSKMFEEMISVYRLIEHLKFTREKIPTNV